jgi:hypothetical protein
MPGRLLVSIQPNSQPATTGARQEKHSMSIKGLTIDARAIGAGLYRIIEQRDQAALVAFGMLPADLMEMLNGVLREKFVSLAQAQGKQLPEAELKDLVSDTEKKVCSAIYSAAAEKGRMLV